MSKGEDTKRRILSQAGAVLNRTGYLATPLSSILRAVQLQKGGLYNHFESKDALIVEAFQANARVLGSYLGTLARGAGDPEAVLWSVVDASLEVANGTVVPGGCPVLKAGSESAEAHESLRKAAAVSLEGLRQLLLIPLTRLEESHRLNAGFDKEALSWLLLTVIEGGILSTRVNGSDEGQRAALRCLRSLAATALV